MVTFKKFFYLVNYYSLYVSLFYKPFDLFYLFFNNFLQSWKSVVEQYKSINLPDRVKARQSVDVKKMSANKKSALLKKQIFFIQKK